MVEKIGLWTMMNEYITFKVTLLNQIVFYVESKLIVCNLQIEVCLLLISPYLLGG